MTRRHAGFTLIEVLIAVAILSFGMLGIAALQVVGMRANQGSYFRSQATYIASDMAERLYANRVGTRALQYDDFDSNNIGCTGTAPTLCSVDKSNTTAPAACSSTAMATFDRFFISCGYSDTGSNRLGGVKDLLPSGRIRIDCVGTCAADALRRIRVEWDERVSTGATTATTTAQAGNQSALQTQTVSLTVQP